MPYGNVRTATVKTDSFIDTQWLHKQVEMLFACIGEDGMKKMYNNAMRYSMKVARDVWIETVRKTYFDKKGVPARLLRYMRRSKKGFEGGKFVVESDTARSLSYSSYVATDPAKNYRWGSSPVGARVFKSSSVKMLGERQPKPFFAQFDSGHKALVVRVSKGYGSPKTKPLAELYRGFGAKGVMRAKSRQDQTKVIELYSPSYSSMFMHTFVANDGEKRVKTPVAQFMGEAFVTEAHRYLQKQARLMNERNAVE
jgi:hypothetical protein